MDNITVRKITFTRDLTEQDFRGIREMLGDKVVQEGTRHVVVSFDNELDYLAFMIATGHVTMTNVGE